MSHLARLLELDQELLAIFEQPEQLDEAALNSRLEERGALLQAVIAEANISPEQAQALVDRSRALKQGAEQARARLAERLATMKKGQASARAYNQVKQQE
ncbi:hypothetical protein ACU6RQ_13665 [Zobellella denitrificans]